MSIVFPKGRLYIAVIIILVLGNFVSPAFLAAMTIKEVGDQLVLSGPIVDGDAEKVRQALAKNTSVRTVIARNSPGGYVPTAYEGD